MASSYMALRHKLIHICIWHMAKQIIKADGPLVLFPLYVVMLFLLQWIRECDFDAFLFESAILCVTCFVSPLSLPAVQGCSVRGHVLEVFLEPRRLLKTPKNTLEMSPDYLLGGSLLLKFPRGYGNTMSSLDNTVYSHHDKLNRWLSLHTNVHISRYCSIFIRLPGFMFHLFLLTKFFVLETLPRAECQSRHVTLVNRYSL